MHSERDYLVKVVFPQLRERLEQYRIHLIDIDLRWGITEEESENDRVLDLCLQQIDTCRPFFVGILGERYGWVPKVFDEQSVSKYGWIQHHTGKSVTELEILYGVLNKPEMHEHSLFYFRDPAFAHDIPESIRADVLSEDAESAAKLSCLKQAIREVALPRPPMENYPCQYAGLRVNWRLAAMELEDADRDALHAIARDGIVDPAEYESLDERYRAIVHRCGTIRLKGLEAFGARVLDDLWQAVKTQYELPDRPPTEALRETDPLAEEDEYHRQFMESRTRIYIGRQEIQRQLHAVADADDPYGCVVTGPAGSGKSAVMAKFAQDYADRHPEQLVIPHFVGASRASTSLGPMLRRFCLILADRFHYTEMLKEAGQQDEEVPVEVPFDTSKLVLTFQDFVRRVPKEHRVVFVIDALNQLDETDNAHELYWLPREWPDSVNCFTSCIAREDKDLPVLEGFQGRRNYTLKVEDLTDDERLAIIADVPSMSAKRLDSQQVRMLIENPATRNPLFLLVALEELRGFGSYEQLNLRLSQLPREGDTVMAIFTQVIDRLENDFDQGVVRRVLSYLACARNGLSETELSEMLEGVDIATSAADLFPILRQVRPYLQFRGEYLDYFHGSFVEAVWDTYLASEESAQMVHRELTHYFYRTLNPVDAPAYSGDSVHALRDVVYHQVRAGELNKAVDTLTSFEFIQAKCHAKLVFELCDDYREARAVLPEAQAELEEERRRYERLARYAAELSAYAKAWSELRDEISKGEPASNAEPQSPEPPTTYRVWTEAEIDAQNKRFNGSPTRLDHLNAFARFVSTESYPLLKYGQREGFIIQHALNYEPSGPVHTAALRLLPNCKGPMILRQWALGKSGNVRPALIATLVGHSGIVEAVDVTPDGRKIVSVGQDETLRIWDPNTGRCLRSIENAGAGTSVATVSSGQVAVSGCCDGSLRVWNLDTGICIAKLDIFSSPITDVDVTPDGRLAISAGHDKTVKLWDLESRDLLEILGGHKDSVHGVSISADGRFVISAGYNLKAWDLKSVNRPRTLTGLMELANCLRTTPDGRLIVSGHSDMKVRIWNLAMGKRVRTLKGHKDRVLCVDITPDGKLAISGSSDNTLRVWDVETGACIRILTGHAESVKSVRILPDGRRAVSSSSDGTIRIWNVQSGDVLPDAGHFGNVTCLDFTPDGRRAVSCGNDGTLKVWDAESGSCLRTLKIQREPSLSLLPDGRRAISGGWKFSDESLEIRDVNTGRLLRKMGNNAGKVTSLAAGPDGRYVASAYCYDYVSNEDVTVKRGSSPTLLVWDINSGKCKRTFQGHVKPVNRIRITPDGFHIVSGSQDGTVRIWNMETGECLRILSEQYSRVRCLDVTPDSKHVVVGNTDNTLRFWDIETGCFLSTLLGHDGPVDSVKITCDGRFMLSGSTDRSLRIWEVGKGECRAFLFADQAITAISICSDRIALGTKTGAVTFLKLCGIEIGQFPAKPDENSNKAIHYQSGAQACNVETGSPKIQTGVRARTQATERIEHEPEVSSQTAKPVTSRVPKYHFESPLHIATCLAVIISYKYDYFSLWWVAGTVVLIGIALYVRDKRQRLNAGNLRILAVMIFCLSAPLAYGGNILTRHDQLWVCFAGYVFRSAGYVGILLGWSLALNPAVSCPSCRSLCRRIPESQKYACDKCGWRET